MIDDVIAGVRDSFLDEGVDEQVLQEMKQVWTNKLMASKAVEAHIEPAESQPPPIVANNTPKSKVYIKFIYLRKMYITNDLSQNCSQTEQNQRNLVHNENIRMQN